MFQILYAALIFTLGLVTGMPIKWPSLYPPTGSIREGNGMHVQLCIIRKNCRRNLHTRFIESFKNFSIPLYQLPWREQREIREMLLQFDGVQQENIKAQRENKEALTTLEKKLECKMEPFKQ